MNINWALKHNSLIASWRLWKSCNWSKTAKEGVASASSLVIFLLYSCYCLVIVFLYVPSLCHFHDCQSYSLKLSRRCIASKQKTKFGFPSLQNCVCVLVFLSVSYCLANEAVSKQCPSQMRAGLRQLLCQVLVLP